MSTINYFITLVISTVGISGIIIYIGKRVVDKSLDIGVERYKSTLEKDLETHKAALLKQTEEFRANLQMLTLEHQIRYTKLHEERGLSVKETYSLLIDLNHKLEYFTTMLQGPEWVTDQERENAARESYQKLNVFFQKNHIYYPEVICNDL